MTDTSALKDRRAQIVAVAGLVVQAVLCTVLLVLGLKWDAKLTVAAQWILGAAAIWPLLALVARRIRMATLVLLAVHLGLFALFSLRGLGWESHAIAAVTRWMLGGLLIWPVIAIVYRQRQRMEAERMEAEELRRGREGGGPAPIFDVDDEGFLVEARRFHWLLRWLVPGAALALAAYHILGSFVGWGWSFGTPLHDRLWSATPDRGRAMVICGAVGFVAFLFSRYAAGMARESGWRLLRAGSSYLAGNALSCVLILLAIALQEKTDVPNPEAIAAYAIRIAMLALGIEFLANYILDFYRPRNAGMISRPAFDSRLLGLISEPGGIAHSIAEAINYQFGFEVSSTWFYQLLKRAMLPMIAFAVLVLFLLSSVVIVDADEHIFVERFGRRVEAAHEPLGPGLHFKWPWPIDSVFRARTNQVRTLTVGSPPTEDETETHEGTHRLKAILWGEKHAFNTEMMVVFASRPPREELNVDRAKAVPIGLLMVSVDIQYSVSDLYDYLYRYVSPEEVVEAIAYQEVTDYAAGVTVGDFLGPGRTAINERLRDRLQKRLDRESLGIKVHFVGLQEAHPESDVAKSFQDVVKAEREKENTIIEARSQAAEALTSAAGSVKRAGALNEAIKKMDALAQIKDHDAQEFAQLQAEVDDLLLGNSLKDIPAAGGDAAQRIADASTVARDRVVAVRREASLFAADRVAYDAAPELYKLRKYLEMLRRSVQDIRKYVLAVRPNKKIIIEFEKEEGGTLDIGGEPKR